MILTQANSDGSPCCGLASFCTLARVPGAILNALPVLGGPLSHRPGSHSCPAPSSESLFPACPSVRDPQSFSERPTVCWRAGSPHVFSSFCPPSFPEPPGGSLDILMESRSAPRSETPALRAGSARGRREPCPRLSPHHREQTDLCACLGFGSLVIVVASSIKSHIRLGGEIVDRILFVSRSFQSITV